MKSLASLTLLSLAILANTAIAGSTSSVGPANPAAVFCVEVGGNLAGVNDTEGNQYSLCDIDDGKIGDWTLFLSLWRESGSWEQQQAVAAFLLHPPLSGDNGGTDPNGPIGAIGMPNPSWQYCSQLGGTNTPAFADGEEINMCQFPDGSSIEAWTLLAGPEVHTRLAQVLSTTPS
jgi:putative hemolysin